MTSTFYRGSDECLIEDFQEKEFIALGWCRTKEEAKAKAEVKIEAESKIKQVSSESHESVVTVKPKSVK